MSETTKDDEFDELLDEEQDLYYDEEALDEQLSVELAEDVVDDEESDYGYAPTVENSGYDYLDADLDDWGDESVEDIEDLEPELDEDDLESTIDEEHFDLDDDELY